MGLHKWLFGNKKESKIETEKNTSEPNQVITKNISKVDSIPISEGNHIVAQSIIPASCDIGNLVFEKKYKEAVELGLKLLEKSPNEPGLLINLMDAYFKGKELVASDYIAKSSYYAKQAILNGHNTGYAEQRLAINLDKAKLFHQSLQLYNRILETEGFHFSSNGCGNCINWNHRRDSILKKMDKAVDTSNDVLFTPIEISNIIQSIKENDDREKREKEWHDRISSEIEKAEKEGDYKKWMRLIEELTKPYRV